VFLDLGRTCMISLSHPLKSKLDCKTLSHGGLFTWSDKESCAKRLGSRAGERAPLYEAD
jgi:hypothetical protein